MAIERIDEFLTTIKNAKTLTDLDLIGDKEMEYLRYATDSIHTLKRILSDYRNCIRDIKLAETKKTRIIARMQLNQAEQKELIEASTKSLDSKKSSKTPINAEEMINTALELIKSDTSYIKVTTGLGLLTGRRPIEILRSGKFFTYNNRNEAISYAESVLPKKLVANLDEIRDSIEALELWEKPFILFVGQAKQNEDSELDIQAKQPYIIPLFCDVNLVINALDKIRKMKPEFLTIEGTIKKSAESVIHSKTNKSLNDNKTGVKRQYRDCMGGDKLSMKELRAIYALIAISMYCKNPRFDETTYAEKILGHSRGSSTNLNYRSYYLA